MKERTTAGGVISLSGALVGVVGVFVAFMLAYEPTMAAEVAAGRPDEETIVQYVFPFLSDIGIMAGALWAIAAYGFFKRERWAWTFAITANVISLLTGFFAMVPPLSRGVFPHFLIVFVPNLITYLLLLVHVRRVETKIVVISLLSGITFVLAFMNGIASTDKIILNLGPLFVAVQRINWIASIGWAVFTVALLNNKEWAIRVGLGAGLLTLTAGIPLAVATTIEAGRFSMFSPAPLLAALLLLILLFIPLGTRAVSQWVDSKPAAA